VNFILMKVYSDKNLFLSAKTIFAFVVFTTKKTDFSAVWQKPVSPDCF